MDNLQGKVTSNHVIVQSEQIYLVLDQTLYRATTKELMHQWNFDASNLLDMSHADQL